MMVDVLPSIYELGKDFVDWHSRITVYLASGRLSILLSHWGDGLSRVIWHYLIRDLPDKQYSWQGFRDRGVSQEICGFYAYGDFDGFSMWTLSGLKKFTHVQATSVYMHEDICGAVQQLQYDFAAISHFAAGGL